MAIIPILLQPIAKALKWGGETKIAKHAGDQVNVNNRKYINGLGVASIIAKDGLGCYLYVTQSLHNKEIPDDKRKFVASLDLTNGGLMIFFQILMFFTVSHKVCQTKMFNEFFGKMFDRPIKKCYRALTKKDNKYKDVEDIQFNEEFTKIKNNVIDAFGGLTSLVAASIVGKRMLVPLVATPLADKVEKRMRAHDAKKKANTAADSQNNIKTSPTMKGAEPEIQPVQAQTGTNLDTGSTNLLNKYRN